MRTLVSSLSLLLLAVGGSDAAEAQAATYHVSVTAGNDANPGTQILPWKTIGKANATVQPGDTVLLHAGTYGEQIRPARSGVSDTNRIVYRVAGDGNVVFDKFPYQDAFGAKGMIALGGLSYVTVSGRAAGGKETDRLIILKPAIPTEVYGNFTGATGCVVENVRMEPGAAEIGPSRGWTFADFWYTGSFESKYNVLRNCDIQGNHEGANIYTEDLVVLAKNAHHNLVENCTIGVSRHVSLNLGESTVSTNAFRGNVVSNPQHTAMSLYGLADVPLQDHHLIENNTLRASGETSSPRGGPGNPLQIAASDVVVRYNLVTEAGAANGVAASLAGIAQSVGASTKKSCDNRYYNNTVVRNRIKAFGEYSFGGGTDFGRSRLWNNFLYDSSLPSTGSRLLVEYWQAIDTGKDRFVWNVLGNPGGTPAQEVINVGLGTVPLSTAAATYRNPANPEFSDWNGFANAYDANLDTNTFTNYAAKDYTLKAGSPYVDAGAPLTKVAAADAGSGTTLSVEDSRVVYGNASEFPAWMGVQCDWIAVGPTVASSVKVQIVSTDDAANTVTLSQPVTRKPGDFVWLWKDSSGRQVLLGAAPDIGAFESVPANPNRPPSASAVSPSSPVTVTAGGQQSFLVAASDPDGDALTYGWTVDASVVPAAGASMDYAPSASEVGSHAVVATVSDGRGGSASASWSVTVTAAGPAAPVLTAKSMSITRIDLFWTNVAGETGYKIEQSSNGVSFAQVGTVAANVTTYSSKLPRGTNWYWFRVRASAAGGDSPYSNVVKAYSSSQPLAPTNLSVAVATPSSIRLTWTDNANNETGFQIQRSTNGGARWFAATTSTTEPKTDVTSFTDLSLAAGQTYTYRVRARKDGTYSSWSNLASVKL